MLTQTPLDGPGLEWAHNLLILVGLVFPTKGCFWPSDLVAPLVPHEFYLFSSWVTPPLCVALSPGYPRSLSLSLSTSSPVFPTPFPYAILLFIARGLWGVSWLHSDLTRVGGVRCDYSWHRIYLVGNGGSGFGSGSGFGTDFRLQMIAWPQYSPRQYRATGEVRFARQTQSRINSEWPDMGLLITYSGRIWTHYEVCVKAHATDGRVTDIVHAASDKAAGKRPIG